MTKVFATFGGSRVVAISADTTLASGTRFFVIDPSTAGLAVRLPDARGFPEATNNPGLDTGGVLTIANYNSGATSHSIDVELHSGATFTGGALSIPHNEFLSFILWDNSTEDGSWTKWPPGGTPTYQRAEPGTGGTGGNTPFSFTFFANTIYYDVYIPTLLTGSGWNGTDPVDVTIDIEATAVIGQRQVTQQAGTKLGALRTGVLPGSSSVTIANRGTISGYGGIAGDGANAGLVNATDGLDGGVGLYVETGNVTIDNLGTIQGGGGGGGGGGNSVYIGIGPRSPYNGGGGGGGAGWFPGEPGAAYNGGAAVPLAGGWGGLNGGGFGGQPGGIAPTAWGGNGGSPGVDGSNGGGTIAPGTGGTGGPYLRIASGVSVPTWTNTGTRLVNVQQD